MEQYEVHRPNQSLQRTNMTKQQNVAAPQPATLSICLWDRRYVAGDTLSNGWDCL